MIRQVIRGIFWVILLIIVLKGCLRADLPSVDNQVKNPINNSKEISYEIPTNKTINGIDYLQSQSDIGNFGGEFVMSTIGATRSFIGKSFTLYAGPNFSKAP